MINTSRGTVRLTPDAVQHIDMTPAIAAVLFAALYALHQDVWFWNRARPLVFGFLPVGLFYHVAYTVVTSLLLWSLVRTRWPSHLDAERNGDE